MRKYILCLALLSLGMACMPQSTKASNTGIELVDAGFSDVNIYLQGSTLHVTGAAGLNLSIYNITGVRVMSIKVDGSDKSYSLSLPKGCYIVKVGNVVRKISIR